MVWYFIGVYRMNRTALVRENIFQQSKRNFVSASSHVISFLYLRPLQAHSVTTTTLTNLVPLIKNIETSRGWDEQKDANGVTHAFSFLPLVFFSIGHFRIVQEQQNRVEAERTNLYFSFLKFHDSISFRWHFWARRQANNA